MERLSFRFSGGAPVPPFAPVLVGVVASGNLEVLLEPEATAECRFEVQTSARGFGDIWAAVMRDFHERHGLGGLQFSLHDMGATPGVVMLRLEQALSCVAGRP